MARTRRTLRKCEVSAEQRKLRMYGTTSLSLISEDMDFPSDFEEQYDETLARAEEDPSEEYPTDDELEWGDPPVTPPRSPIVIEDSDEMISDDADTEIAEDFEEEVPLPPPVLVVPAVEHDWVVSHLISDLDASEARVYELEQQLAAARRARRCTRQITRRSVLRGVRADVRRIERRAFSRLRSLARAQGSRIRRRDTERVVERAMLRVREMTRTHAD